MKVLILGGNGFLGPHVARALALHHQLRITDIRPASDEIEREFSRHEFLDVDITRPDEVRRAAKGVDAIVNLAVVRTQPSLAFAVNTLGCYHVMRAAVEQGIRRVVNSGPHFAVAGPGYEDFDFGISPDVPPHPGTGLYPLTKSLGQEICRGFTRTHAIHVVELLYYDFRAAEQLKPGGDGVPFIVSWTDGAEAVRLAVEIDAARLPSRCEVFFILGNAPQQKFLNEKARRILGFSPKSDTSILWRRPRR